MSSSKLLARFNNKNILALAGNAVISLFGLITYSILYHHLSKPDAGKWFVFLTIVSVCEALRNGFLGTATVKFYAGTEQEKGTTILGSVWFLAIALTGAVLLINAAGLLLLPLIHDEEFVVGIKWFGITFLSSLPFSVIYWKLQADEQYGKMLWLKMVNSISTPLSFILLFVFNKMTFENVVLFNFLTNCLTSLAGLVGGLGNIRSVFRRSKESILELIHFGKYSMGTTLSATLLSSTDTFIIAFILGPSAVAIYTLPRQLMQVIEMFLRTFVGTGMSKMAIAFNQQNMHHVAYIMKKYSGMLTVAFIPVALVTFLFAGIIVDAYAGGKYVGTEAANIYRLIMLFSLVYPIDRFNGATLDIIHKPKINFQKTLIMLGMNIIADLTALMLFKNLYAVVFAGLITNLTAIYFGYYHLRKYIDYSITGTLSMGFTEMTAFVRKQLGPKGQR